MWYGSRKKVCFLGSNEKNDKELLIKKEYKKLTNIYKNLDENKKKIILPLIQKAAFMHVELEELQSIITKDGCVCEYQNGENQKGTKKTPEVDIYNTMVKNYASIIKHLTDLVPVAKKKESRLAALMNE